MSETLGTHTAVALRAGGFQRRGILQPLPLPGLDPGDAEQGAAVGSAAEGGSLDPSGPLASVLRMQAVARTILVVTDGRGALVRYVFARVGADDDLLDLRLAVDGTLAAIRWSRDEADEVVAGVAAGLPGATLPAAEPGSDGPPTDLLTGGGVVRASIQAVSLLDPPSTTADLRLQVVEAGGAGWLTLGWRDPGGDGLQVAPLVQGRVAGVVDAMVRAAPAVL